MRGLYATPEDIGLIHSRRQTRPRLRDAVHVLAHRSRHDARTPRIAVESTWGYTRLATGKSVPHREHLTFVLMLIPSESVSRIPQMLYERARARPSTVVVALQRVKSARKQRALPNCSFIRLGERTRYETALDAKMRRMRGISRRFILINSPRLILR